jgi:hypothetical protein
MVSLRIKRSVEREQGMQFDFMDLRLFLHRASEAGPTEPVLLSPQLAPGFSQDEIMAVLSAPE